MATDGPLTEAPRRVGHVLTGDAWAGAEAQAWELVRRLPAHGFSPHVALLNEGEVLDRFTALSTPVKLIGAGRKAWPRLARELRRWLGETEVQLVHVHKRKEELLIALCGRQAAGAPLVRTLHGAPELPSGRNRWKGVLARELDFLALRHRTDAVIAVSEELAARLRPRLGGTPVRVIHNGIALPPPTGDSPDEHPPRLAYCGRLAPVKRVDRLIRALPRVREAVRDAELWIAGEGSEEARLRNLAHELGVEDAIRFLGFQPNVYNVLHAVDAVVLSSDHEGLPMIVLEAGAAGKPVVAPAVGGIPEAVRDGETGVLLPAATPGSLSAACIQLLADRARARAWGEAARRHMAANFAVESTAAATAELYAEVLQSAGRDEGRRG